MHVERAVASRVKKRRRKQQAVRRHHKRIRPHGANLFELRRAFQAAGLEDGDRPRSCEALHCTFQGPQTPTGGTVGLRENQRYLVACVHEARQHSLSELGRAGED